MTKGNKLLIFIVEDDYAFNKLLSTHIKNNGFPNVESFYSGEEAMDNMLPTPEIVIMDYDLTGINGLETMKYMRSQFPDIQFIFISGQNSIQVAVDTLKYGAYDYIIKDSLAKEKIVSKVRKINDVKRLIEQKRTYKRWLIFFSSLLVVTWLVIIILEMTHTL